MFDARNPAVSRERTYRRISLGISHGHKKRTRRKKETKNIHKYIYIHIYIYENYQQQGRILHSQHAREIHEFSNGSTIAKIVESEISGHHTELIDFSFLPQDSLVCVSRCGYKFVCACACACVFVSVGTISTRFVVCV